MSDNGFLNLGINRSLNSGNRLENIVFTVLNRDVEDITYIKDTYEINFFCEDTYYQVSYEISDEKTLQRELNAFSYFNKDNKFKNRLITYDVNEKLENIDVLSLEKFIFEGKTTLR